MTRHALTVNDPELWMKCAGNIPFDLSIKALVYYLPEGDADSAGRSEDQEFKNRLKNIYKSAYLCQILSIEYLADAEYEEVFAKIRLKAVEEDEYLNPLDVFDRAEDDNGFFVKTLTGNDINKALYLPKSTSGENGVFPSYEANSELSQDIELIDFDDKRWKLTHIYQKAKDCFGLGAGWIKFLKEKKLTLGDTVIFKKNSNPSTVSVAFQRKDSPSAKKYGYMVEDYSLEGCIESHARSAEAREEFTVIYFPHWIEFLVHPNVSFSSKGKLAKNMRVKKSNPQGTGRNCVGGYLQILDEANDLTWSMSKVHWDGECIASWVNHWQIQPLVDPIPGRLKHRISKLRPRRPNPSKKAPTLETSSNTEDGIPESNTGDGITGDGIPNPESNTGDGITGDGIPNPESNTGDGITESESNTRDGITKSNTGDGITESESNTRDGITESNTRDGITKSNTGDGIQPLC